MFFGTLANLTAFIMKALEIEGKAAAKSKRRMMEKNPSSSHLMAENSRSRTFSSIMRDLTHDWDSWTKLAIAGSIDLAKHVANSF